MFEVFSEICRIEKSARLILVGTGTEEEIAKINEYKMKYGVQEKTILLGMRIDATSIMNIFDVFVFPSISEGFPLVLVEAQSLGVRCITSDIVPDEMICDNCFAMSLEEAAEKWACVALADNKNPTENRIEQFDIINSIMTLMDLYQKAINS